MTDGVEHLRQRDGPAEDLALVDQVRQPVRVLPVRNSRPARSPSSSNSSRDAKRAKTAEQVGAHAVLEYQHSPAWGFELKAFVNQVI